MSDDNDSEKYGSQEFKDLVNSIRFQIFEQVSWASQPKDVRLAALASIAADCCGNQLGILGFAWTALRKA